MTRTTTTTTTTEERDPFDLLAGAAVSAVLFVAKGWALLIYWAILYPVLSVPVLLAVAAGIVIGWPAGTVVAALGVVAVLGFRRYRPELFARWVTARIRSRFLTWWRYRRHWTRRLTACGLTLTTSDRNTVCPRLLAVAIGSGTDRVRVRMLEGQCPADYDHRTDQLAHAFGADACQTTLVGPGTYELRFRFGDALADTVIRPRVDHWTTPPTSTVVRKGFAA